MSDCENKTPLEKAWNEHCLNSGVLAPLMPSWTRKWFRIGYCQAISDALDAEPIKKETVGHRWVRQKHMRQWRERIARLASDEEEAPCSGS